MNKPVSPAAAIKGEEHWTNKGSDVRLFLWNKYADPSGPAGRILFVHGSSMASKPTFDLQVPGRPSPMDYFAARGYDCWCVDMEGYGRSTKDRDNNAPISYGADDCFAAAQLYREAARQEAAAGLRHFVGRAARRAVCRSAIPRWSRGSRSTPWCGPAKARRRSPSARKKLPEFRAKTAPADRPQVRALDLRARSSRHRRRQRDRGVRRRDPQARRFDPERHLCRHVLEPAGVRSGEDQGGDARSCAASTTASPA